MPKNFEKFIFLGAIVALALLSRALYPEVYGLAHGESASSTGNPTLTADAPLFVMPNSGNDETGSVATTAGASTMLGNEDLNQNTAAASAIPPSTANASSSLTAAPFAAVGDAPVPSIAAQALLVADLESETVYASNNMNVRWPLASVTKLMTASLVIDDMGLDQKVTVPADAIAADPSQQLIAAGETFTVSDLLHILLLPSSNVAAETLADYYGRTRFIQQMNDRAASWGMTSTHYDDPSGLSASNQSTPEDLMKLAQQIYVNYPQILAITRTPQISVTDYASGKSILVRSINNFAGRADFIGGKTGYTDEASGNLLSIFKYEGRPILVVVMGTSDNQRFDNSVMLYNWFTQNYK